MTPDELRYLTALKRRRAALSAKDDLLSFAKLIVDAIYCIIGRFRLQRENTKPTKVDMMERAEARKQGLTRYFTGRPCCNGHVCERYTASLQCVMCSSDISKARYHAKIRRPDTRAWVKGGNPNRPSSGSENRALYERNRYQRLRDAPEKVIRKNLRARFWTIMKGHVRTSGVMKYVGCSVADLISHISDKFVDGMSWDNYGEWHVDHIRPCASFDFTDAAQIAACWHFTNLQPLWASENCSKRDRYAGVV